MYESSLWDRKDKPHIRLGTFTKKYIVVNRDVLDERGPKTWKANRWATLMNQERCEHYWTYYAGGHKGAVYRCVHCGKRDED